MNRSSEILADIDAIPLPARGQRRWSLVRKKLKASPILTQAVQMMLTRGIGLLAAALGSVWAARCLGPHRLGISGMVLATVAPLGLLVDLGQDAGFVRQYKACSTELEKRRLIQSVFAFRWMLCATILLAGVLSCLLLGLPGPEWKIGVCAAFPLLLFTVNQGTWALQGQENMPARYRALLVQSLVGSGMYFIFFRPGAAAAGTDVIVSACATGGEFLVGWWFASRPMRRDGFAFVEFSLFEIRHRIKEALGMYWNGRWLALGGIIGYLYLFVQTPLIGTLLGTTSVGQYRTALTLVNGFQAFAVIVPALLYPKMINWSREGSRYLWSRQWEIFRTALMLFIPGIIAAFIAAPYVYKLLYGPAFLVAAYPFAILLGSKMLIVLNGIFAWGLWARGHDRLMLVLTGSSSLIGLALNFVIIPRWGIRGAATVNVVSEALVLLATLVASRMLLSEEFSRKTPILT